MHHQNPVKALRLHLLVLAIFLAIAPRLLWGASPEQSEFDTVWQRVQQSGAYQFTADVTQTNTPRASVINAGRQSKVTSFYLEGETDIPAESLHLTLWSSGGSALIPESGLQVHVEGQTARARQGTGAWEEIEDFTGLFAPGGDFLAYTRAAKEVVRHEPEIRETPLGAVQVTRYTFAIDGRRFAEHMHTQLREQAMRAGLPAHAQFELSKTYLQMHGTGELWVGENGLPLHQQFSLHFPETGESYATSAEISVNFSNFAPLPATGLTLPMERGGWLGLDAVSMLRLTLTVATVLFACCGLVLVITRRRSRPVYVAVVGTVILSMVSVPWLSSRQVSAYTSEQSEKRTAHEDAQAKQDALDTVESQMKTTDFDPHQDPLAAARQRESVAEAAQTVDDDAYDGRYVDELCETDPHGDADGDTLTNLEECLLGTQLAYADTDQDGVDDNVEVAGFQLPGSSTTWYSDPTQLDTNRDGLGDGEEWYLDANGNQVPDDTDGDGTPDLWDEDNDGDGVIDDLDMSVYAHTEGVNTFTESVPLQLKMNELVAGELVKVEFQLKPTNPDHLWYSHNVLDWPVNDLRGHLQDADGLTFLDVNPDLSPSPNDNGDMRMVPLLEIEIPIDSANLPPAGTCTDDDGNTYDCYPLLEEFGISTHMLSDDIVAAYVPLQLVSNGNGDSNVAFYGRMLYQAADAWQDAHSVRLVWAIQMLNDVCAEFEDGICAEYSAYNQLQIIQTYYDDWYLTGLAVTEDHSADIALIYEDPAAPANTDVNAPLYLDTLYALLYGLDMSFLAGRDCESVDAQGDCVGNGQRDVTVDEIARRFNHTTNGAVSDEARWDLPNVLGVVAHEYDSIDLGLMDTTTAQTAQLLDEHFTAAWSAGAPIMPTILMASEEHYRALNLDQTAVTDAYFDWSGNALTVGLLQGGDDVVEVETIATLKWTPYTYDPTAGWETADITDFLDALTDDLADGFENITDPDETATYQTMAQVLYMAAFNGSSYVVQIGEKIRTAAYGETDIQLAAEFGNAIGALLIIGLSQYFDYSDALRIAAEQMRNERWYMVTFNTKWTKFWQYQFDLYGNKLFAFGALAFSAVAYLILFTVLIVKLTGQDQWEGWDILAASAMIYLTVVMNIIVPIRAALIAARTAAGVIQWGLFWKSLATMQKIKSAAGYAALVGLVIAVAIAIGIFIWAWASGKVSPGEIEFFTLLAYTIASIIIAVIFFVIALTVVGAIILSIIVLIDIILLLAGVDFSITGFFTDVLATIIYRYSVTEPKVTAGSLQADLQEPERGYEAGNPMVYSLPITTTIYTLFSAPSDRTLSNSMVYELDSQKNKLSTSINARKNDWISVPPDFPPNFGYAQLVDEPAHSEPLVAGANAPIDLYLNAAYALRGRECWLLFICKDRTLSGHVSEYVTEAYVGDVLPATLDEFVDVGTWGRSPDRGVIGNVRFLDPDGDGLLAARDGGLDPNNSRWDSDNDGLNDGYEVFLRGTPADEGGVNLNPLAADTDGDGVLDGDELRYGSDPARVDTDGDGLSDAVEILPNGGWNLPYRYNAADGSVTETRLWSNPLSPDIDGDGLSDLFERTQLTCPTCMPWADPENPEVYHPSVWNESPVALYVDDDTADGFFAPGATVVYTTTTENNLGSGQELVGELTLDIPEGVNGGPLSAPVNIGNGESASLVSDLGFGGQSTMDYDLTSRTQLTNFFETRWNWDAPSSVVNNIRNNVLLSAVASPLTGWSGSHLVVTRELTTSGIDTIAAYVVESDGTVVASQEVFRVPGDQGLSGPSVACNANGICMVVWGFYDDYENPLQLPAVMAGRRFNGSLGNSQQVTFPQLNTQTQRIRNVGIATDGSDFMATWASNTFQSSQNTQVYIAPISVDSGVGNRSIVVGNASGSQAAAIEWNGIYYTLAWTGNSTISWRDVAPDGTLPGSTINSVQGNGWSLDDGNKRPPTMAYDAISHQTLLAYRSPAGTLVARTTDNTTGAPFTIASTGVNGANVSVALAPDSENGGWIAAWTQAGDGQVEYQAISPAGFLRGDSSGFDQNALTTVALTCIRPRALAEFLFDEEADATSFADSSGNGRDAVCADNCPQSGVSGRSGNAVSFSAPNQEALRVDGIDLVNRSFTFSAWVKYNPGGSPDGSLFSQGRIVANEIAKNVRMGITYPGNMVCLIQETNVIVGATVPDNQWHHWACTFDKNTRRLTLYLDGQQVDTNTTSEIFSGSGPFYIGRVDPDSIAPFYFTGEIDSAMVVDRALSADEIAGIAQGAIAAYALDEPPGAEIFVNAISDGLNGRCESTATCPALGVPGAAFTAAEFDGQNDYIAIGDQNNSLALANSSLTISAWVKRNSAGRNDFIFSQGTGATYQGFNLGFLNDNTLRCGPWNDTVTTSARFTDREWRHVACTFDLNTRQLRLYYEGAEVASKTTSGVFTGAGTAYIGQRLDNQRRFFGAIDEVGIWQTALTGDEIAALYNKVKVVDESVLTCQLPAATGNTLTMNNLVLRQTTTTLGEINQSIERTLTLDADLPVSAIAGDAFGQGGNAGYLRSPHALVLAGEASDATSYVTLVEVNPGNGWQAAEGTEAWAFTWDTSEVADGLQTIRVRATDVAGNLGSVSSWATILDNTPPDATITAPSGALRPTRRADGRWHVPLAGTVTDPLAGTEPGSGVEDVDVLLHGIDDVAGLGWQAATFDESGVWQLDYGLPVFHDDSSNRPDPTGAYSVTVRAADPLSNTIAAADYPTIRIEIDVAGPVVTPSVALSNTEQIVTEFTVDGTVVDDGTVERVEVNLTPGEQIDALDGVVLHLPFDERHATEYFDDQSGANNDAICDSSACPTVDQLGRRDRAVRLDGVDDYLRVPALLDPSVGAFTAAAWVHVDELDAPQYILQQRDGTGTGRTWLALTATGEVHTFLGGSGLNSETRIAPNEWHHAAITYDGTTLKIYVDGVLDKSAERTLESSNGELFIGANKVPNLFYDGWLDEIVVHDRALADYEIANLYAYGRGTWVAATLAGDEWRYAVPTGAQEGLEGLYQLNVRSFDGVGNVTPQGGQRVWRGEIDTRPPEIAFTAETDTSGNSEQTTYTCIATDFNLVESTTCLPGQTPAIPKFRASDTTLTPYAAVNTWYANTITDTARLYGMEAMRAYPNSPVEGQTMTACDAYGHCSETDTVNTLLPSLTLDAEILDPSGGTVLTKTHPITIEGDAYAADGLQHLVVTANGAIVHTQEWRTDNVTAATWQFAWTPPGEGIYHFEPVVDGWAGETPPRRPPGRPNASGQATASEPRIFLPWIMGPTSGSGNQNGGAQLYLPFAATDGAPDDAYAGPDILLYVDLNAPTVAIDNQVLTSVQAIGDRVVQLTGTALDGIAVHRVDVRVDRGPWQRAGFAAQDRWQWLWWFDSPPDGESYEVNARAVDLAGRTTTVTRTVQVDTVAPVPGEISLAYITPAGERHPATPGATLTDAAALELSWTAATDGNGPIRYDVGFSMDSTPDAAVLTRYDAAGTHTMSVAAGERWYASVQYTDDAGNARTITLGPVAIGNSTN